MKNSLANHVMQKISEVKELYFRLILLVGPSGCGKTKLLQELSTLTSAPLINVNLELSRVLLDLSERQRVLQLARILSKIVAEQAPRRCSQMLVATWFCSIILKFFLIDTLNRILCVCFRGYPEIKQL